MIHRDIKPANILLVVGGDSVASGNRPLPEWQPLDVDLPQAAEPLAPLTACTPKLTDFGLAQLRDADAQGGESLAAGTPSYMSPEQASGAPVGPAADVWALGATLYELLTGRPPFRAASTEETLRLVLFIDPIPPSQLQPSVPRDLDTICLKCLQKEPGRRYLGGRELAQDLRRFLAGEAILARPAGLRERTMKWARRHPSWAVLAAPVLFSILAAVTVNIVVLVRRAHRLGPCGPGSTRSGGRPRRGLAARAGSRRPGS